MVRNFVRAILLASAVALPTVSQPAFAQVLELGVDQSPAGLREQARAGQHVFALIERLGKPVIAAINGHA